MKCLLLAGGRGDRLWPLSRKNYPKQFIQIKNNHSIFQETILRNMAFCDEFIIVTNKEYQNIIENQMKAFQGLTYRCVFEEVGRKTTAAIVLSCLQFPMSEIMFVVASDHLIAGESYKDDILHAKELAKQGFLVTFGMDIQEPDTRFGYIHFDGENVLGFTEKPDDALAESYVQSREYFVNSGMFLFRIGDFLSDLKMLSPYIASLCESSFYMRKTEGNYTYYTKDVLEGIPALPIEKTVFESTQKGKVIHSLFYWKDIGSLEDIEVMDIGSAGNDNVIAKECLNTTVINQCEDRLIVANHLDDVMVVNTKDAVYIGKKGYSNQLKEIIKENSNHRDFFDKSRIYFRKWGNYEILQENIAEGYQIRKVTVLQGKTIYVHMHEKKCEHWCILLGQAKTVIDGKEEIMNVSDTITIQPGITHQVSSIGEESLVFIETSTGIIPQNEDIISIVSKDLSEASLGFEIEPFIKLSPAYKDYLWGGTKLREQFGKECEYDIIAESWELSAHPAGQSIVASGKYKGLLFDEYLRKIGNENLGWKNQNFQQFPILIKLIDAKEDLSIQVHPGDEYALEHENEYGKCEMWYIMDSEPGAAIYCGFNKDVSKEELMQYLADGNLLSLLNKIDVKEGETYYIPSGTVHAIGQGCMICEIQQSSNSTYRLYDYNRTDKYGNSRKLDVEKALEVLDLKKYENFHCQEQEQENGELICRCKYFESIHYQCEDTLELELNEDSFFALIVIGGEGSIRYQQYELTVTKGDCIFIPKKNARIYVTGTCEFIGTHI